MKKGRLTRLGCARQYPASVGEIAAPTERATVVIPEAAERSSGCTTAIVYDCRVGTSICEMQKRTSRTATASVTFGIKGTRISSTFDGRCVKTIVLISPNRFARLDAPIAEAAASRLATKNMLPSSAGSR